MDLALLSANANQLRHALDICEPSRFIFLRNGFIYFLRTILVVLLGISIFLQVLSPNLHDLLFLPSSSPPASLWSSGRLAERATMRSATSTTSSLGSSSLSSSWSTSSPRPSGDLMKGFFASYLPTQLSVITCKLSRTLNDLDNNQTKSC